MKVNFRTQMRKAKLKNLSDLSFESKIPIQQLEDLFNGELTAKNLETINQLQVFFGCRLDKLFAVEGAIWEFKGCSYEGAVGVVYFIKNKATGLTKIGFTYNLLSRIPNLAIEHKAEMELIHYVSGYDVGTLEKVFHTMFSEKRIDGEWFCLSAEDIEKIKQF